MTQYNIEVISKLMQTWKDKPLFTRTETEKKVNLLDVDGELNIFVQETVCIICISTQR